MDDKIKGLEKEVDYLKNQVEKIYKKLFPDMPETDIRGDLIRK